MSTARIAGWGLCCVLAATAAAEPRTEAKARMHNVEQYINDWDIPAAKKELTELEKLAPDGIEPLQYFRGRVAFEEGRYPEAVRLLTAAGIEDKPGSYLRLAQDTLKITQDHLHQESEHFIFYYPPGKDAVLAPYALETLEAQRAALEKDLGYAPEGKVRVEVVNDAAQLAKVSTLTKTQIETTGTIAICKFNKLMVTSPRAVWRGYDWQDTLAHEYTHLVVSQKSHNTVPIWLHEGIAKYFESRWRGPVGLAMNPSTLALLGDRVRKDKLVPFEKMHPSIAALPSSEDAATAFAEVFFAIDYIFKSHGAEGVRTVIDQLATGVDDKKAVEVATRGTFSGFERAWLAHVRKQPFPKELIPHDYQSQTERAKRLKEGDKARAEKPGAQDKGKELSFGDFAEVDEPEARKFAHLGELMRERSRAGAAAEEYGRAHAMIGDKYESVSNKYALALLELRRTDEAEKVLQGSLRVHPGSPQTHVHLGRIYLAKKDYPHAKGAYLDALASDPFDQEIHVSLAAVFDALHDKPMAERARKATALLTGLTTERVEQLAHQVVKEPEAKADQRRKVEPVGPTRGPASAAVTIVEFSDFQCPFCKRGHDTVEQVMAAYPGKVRLVFRQFPLDMHDRAETAAEAALCAHQQDKFWPYHDLLFQNPRRLAMEDLKEYAATVGLDRPKFVSCLESGNTAAAVKADEAAGTQVGVTGTPAFFINGVFLQGAQPFSEFKRVIDAELGAN